MGHGGSSLIGPLQRDYLDFQFSSPPWPPCGHRSDRRRPQCAASRGCDERRHAHQPGARGNRRPLVEWPDLAGIEGRGVVILAEPRGGVAVVEQDASDGGLVPVDEIVLRVRLRTDSAMTPKCSAVHGYGITRSRQSRLSYPGAARSNATPCPAVARGESPPWHEPRVVFAGRRPRSAPYALPP
jgi:hypothetical protein